MRARLAAVRAAQEYVSTQLKRGLLTKENYDIVAPDLEQEIEQYSGKVSEALSVLPDIQADELEATRREVLQAKRDKLRSLHSDGIITGEVYSELRAEIDAELTGE